jgi:hypothetical protein
MPSPRLVRGRLRLWCMDVNHLTPERTGVIAGFSGVLTGIAAGFIGVGRGEFRIPVLVEVLALPLKVAGGVNLLVGLFTVALGVYRRWGAGVDTRRSCPGRDYGERLDRRCQCGSVLQGEAAPASTQVDRLCLPGSHRPVDAVRIDRAQRTRPTRTDRDGSLGPCGVYRACHGVVSGVLGVAGGEMRLPALLYLFGIPIKAAGTFSLMISIPTLAAGALTDRRLARRPSECRCTHRRCYGRGVGRRRGARSRTAALRRS